MIETVNELVPHAVNTVLILVIGFLLKHELHDIKSRIVRIENLFLKGDTCKQD